MSLNDEKIHGIAASLVEKGKKPTLANVREALGGGSFTTISESMKKWHSKQQKQEELNNVQLPDALQQSLQSVTASLWSNAVALANEKLTSERLALQEAQAQAQQAVDEYSESMKVLENENSELQAKINQLEKEQKAAQLQEQQAREESHALAIKLAKAEGEVKAKNEQIDQLRSDNKKLTEQSQ